MSKYNTWIFIIAVIVLPVIAYLIVSWYGVRYSDLPVYGNKGHTIAGFKLHNQYGNIVTGEEWNKKIIVADFFFTSCPTICPRMTRNLSDILKAFPGDSQILINSFSVDPVRDSISRLAGYADKFNVGDRWNLLTGDKREIYRLARSSFLIIATDGDGGENDFIHSDQFILVDGQKRIRGFYNGTDMNQVKLLINDIRKLKKENIN